MAQAKFILQAITDKTHSQIINSIFAKDLNNLLVSVAFAKTQGVSVISKFLNPTSKIFVGIRNDITSYQAIEMLFATGAKIYTVDTGSRNNIFHPKIYLARNENEASVIIGSANLTFGGLFNNIEGSSIITLNLGDEEDSAFLKEITAEFDVMPTKYPNHVVEVTSQAMIGELFLAGLLTDETVIAPLRSVIKNFAGEQTPLMPLYRAVPKSIIKKKVAVAATSREVTNSEIFYLVWQSNELTERDLNIPTGKNTNSTGSMNLSKGAYDDIDQRHHFRDDIFADVLWIKDDKLLHYERAIVKFYIYVKGEFQGEFILRVSHNTDMESKTYKQSNSMTHISWGEAKSIIARKDLLGRILYLSKRNNHPPDYMIAID